MKKIKEFQEELTTAVEQQKEFLETDILPKSRELFKTYQSAFNAVFMLLLKKALIKDDPYKHEYKISEITVPPNTPIIETEKGSQLGIRLSFYLTQLEYINSYYSFKTQFITPKRIKLLTDLLNYIDWDMVAETSATPATRVLAGFLIKIRQGTDQIAVSVINTSMNQLSSTRKILVENLHHVKKLHNETYKLMVREKILLQSNLYKYAIENSAEETFSSIKKKFTEVLPGEIFRQDLINELINEEFSADSDELKEELLNSLIPQAPEKKKEQPVKIKKPQLNILVNAALTICSSSSQIRSALEKIENNFKVLEEPKGSAFIKWLYRVLKADKKIKRIFEIEFMDDQAGLKKTEKIDLPVFMKNNIKTITNLSSSKLKSEFSVLESTMKKEDYLLLFIGEQNTALKSFILQGQGIDRYTKKRAKDEKISSALLKGILLEINAIKNCIIKAQQLSQQYLSDKEEYNQFKSLGIVEKSVD
ncbi:MAG: hypothetical protein RBT69_07240 [Spirochaetia bacterium]|jgi:hypothetical protein|nr:hypothetical protein [Spirochaetia bacterium]